MKNFKEQSLWRDRSTRKFPRCIRCTNDTRCTLNVVVKVSHWMDHTQPKQLRITFPRSRLSDVIGANEEMFLSDRAFISDLSILRARLFRYAERSPRRCSALVSLLLSWQIAFVIRSLCQRISQRNYNSNYVSVWSFLFVVSKRCCDSTELLTDR